jgi:5-methylcytosine-specific restriction endonuclease McrA
MSGPVFVVDAEGMPLMPMSAAYARKLLREGKAQRRAHSAFTVIQLSHPVQQPMVRPIIAVLRLHLRTAELFLVAEGRHQTQPLGHIVIDLRTDLPRRLRRRAGHRRRRRSRQRYHALSRYGRPFKLRRPSLTRSTWGSALRSARYRHRRSSRRTKSETPVLRWRAQAIKRTLNALQQLVPISHLLLLDSGGALKHRGRPCTPAERRLRLIAAYAYRDSQKRLTPVCAFCGTAEGVIEVEHLLPVSRGGTDAWENLALACRTCNQRKSDRTVEEAGMQLRLHHGLDSRQVGRLRPYVDGTLRALRSELRHTQLTILNPAGLEQSDLSRAVIDTALTKGTEQAHLPAYIIAYPVPRPRKQRFSSRNYPLHTPKRRDLMQVRQTLKRQIRVNAGLLVQRVNARITTTVMSLGTGLSKGDDSRSVLIRPGMLCAASRAGELVVGIVSAIHSSGRLSLRVLEDATSEQVSWRTVVVSPRQGIRLISTDRVIMMPLSSHGTPGATS